MALSSEPGKFQYEPLIDCGLLLENMIPCHLGSVIVSFLCLFASTIHAQQCEPWIGLPAECASIVASSDHFYNLTVLLGSDLPMIAVPFSSTQSQQVGNVTQLVSAVRMFYPPACRHSLLRVFCSTFLPPCGLFSQMPILSYCEEACQSILSSCSFSSTTNETDVRCS